MDINLRVAGEAGQGVATTGSLLVGALAGMGLHVASTQSYMSRIRGGLNWFDIRIGDREIFAGREKADVLVALTDAALRTLRGEMAPGGVVMYDGQGADEAMAMPFTKAAKELAKSALMANSVASGAVFTVLGYDLEKLCEYLAKQFEKKGPQVVDSNIACARRGSELAGPHAGAVKSPAPSGRPRYLIDGASAIGLAAATAGVKFVSAYPMTPSTPTFTYLAGVADKYGIVVEQAEDEIAAVNMVCGATYAGVPAMATTSGGGFALMVEALALAGMIELPIFIVVGQRPGPATGLPTRTAQQDLRFALHAGHGEFVRAVFAPGTVEQSYALTRRALETAHRFQTPVILLTDQFLQDMRKTTEPLDESYRPIDRCIVEDAASDYVRYAVTDSGVSPRAIPGGQAAVVCDSDEHTFAGRISEDLIGHVAQQDKRMRKFDGLLAEAMPPEFYGPENAETLLVCWGSTYGPCREAVDGANAGGRGPAAMLHFSQVWPLRSDVARRYVHGRKQVFCVEANCGGQFASLLREQGACGDCKLILRYDGLPFTAEYILEKLQEADP
ncbi:MAG TPA: 2-oxoacid:acceptor oxidoreductase subunit alpha [Phycisphaerae bacterium]|nr:2-oxoacid:acceptor oxidoreductase subunit alpha [Phycisphaerae bacterium]